MQADPPPLSAEDNRSWHLNAAALARAVADWERWEPKIRANLATARRAAGPACPWLDRLEALVDQGSEALREAMLAITAEGQVPRSCSPLAGILPEADRQRVLRATSRPRGPNLLSPAAPRRSPQTRPAAAAPPSPPGAG
ncbi:MAG: hypothetical protein ACP5NP_09835 [Acetobacteraceae bacterium]